MRWRIPWARPQQDHPQDERIKAAHAQVAELQQRGEAAAAALQARRRRNHWGETVEAIVRGAQ